MAFPAVTYTFTNGTTADATQVNQNFTDVLNGFADGTKSINISAITALGTASLNGDVNLGDATGDTISVLGSLGTSIPVKVNTTYDIGTSTLGLRSIYIGGSSTFTTRIIGGTQAASVTYTLPTAQATAASYLANDGAGALSWADKTGAQTPSNFLLNGAFDVWQRGTTTTIANTVSTYMADRWYVKNSLGTNGVITFSQATGVTNGSLFGAKVQITTAPTVGQTNGTELYQTLENKDSIFLYGQTASFTVLVKSFGNVNQVGVQFYYKTSEGKVDTAIGSEVLTTVNTASFTACSITGQALGTAMGTAGVVGVRIRITAVSSGNTYDLNNGFVCEQAIVSKSNAIATFTRQHTSYASELLACQRFCWVFAASTTNSYIATGQATSTTAVNAIIPLPTSLRTTSTSITTSAQNHWGCTQAAGGITGTSTASFATNSPSAVLAVFGGMGSLAAGNAVIVVAVSGSTTLTVDAEI